MTTLKMPDRTRTIAAIAALTFTIGSISPVFAAGRDPEGSAPAPKARVPQLTQKEQRICIDEDVTGSLARHRTCKTREQWIKDTGVDPLGRQER